MQKTYDRITIPKIVICTKSLEDCVDKDECDRKSLSQRKIIRSRSRRYSRRFSSSIVDRRSPSSSRSPSPSLLASQPQDQNKEKSKNNHHCNQDSEKLHQLEIESDNSKEVDDNNCKKEENSIVDRLRNDLFECENKEKSNVCLKFEEKKRRKKSLDNVKILRNDRIDGYKRNLKCDKCSKYQSNGEEICLENCSGYQQYLRLLEVPQINLEWGEGSSGDDLSSEWDSDYTDKSNEKKIPKVTAGKNDL